jgi:hypothetical protein
MDIVDKLRSQIGDDVQHIFDHEALFRLAADEIENLRQSLADAQYQAGQAEAEQDYQNHIAFLRSAQGYRD